MKTKKNKLFFIVTLILCILLFAIRLTGPIWHVVLGLILMCIMVKHICKRLVCVKNQSPKVRFVDYVLLGTLAVMFVTGMLMHPLQGMFWIKLLHKLSAVIFVIGLFGHVAQHSKAKRMTGKEIRADEV